MTEAMTKNATAPSAAFSAATDCINKRELAGKLGVSTRFVEQAVSEGRLPAPLKLSSRCARWRLADIERWLAERARS
jgi:predicted DNA-binding transcriptional regulator AlpA